MFIGCTCSNTCIHKYIMLTCTSSSGVPPSLNWLLGAVGVVSIEVSMNESSFAPPTRQSFHASIAADSLSINTFSTCNENERERKTETEKERHRQTKIEKMRYDITKKENKKSIKANKREMHL